MPQKLGKRKKNINEHLLAESHNPRSFLNVPSLEWTSNQVEQYIRFRQKEHFFKGINEQSPEFYTDEFSHMGFGGERQGTIWSKIKNTLFAEFDEGGNIKEYIDWVFDTKAKKFDAPIPLNIIICKTWRKMYKKYGGVKKKGAYGE